MTHPFYHYQVSDKDVLLFKLITTRQLNPQDNILADLAAACLAIQTKEVKSHVR